MNTLMVLLGVAVLFISMEVSLGALSAACLEDSDCSDVAGAECVTYDGCNNGTCTCMDGYMQSSTSCKAVKAKDAECNAATDVCESNLECSGSPAQCVCPTGETWHTKQMMCFAADEYVAIEGTCTGDAQCYAHDDANTAGYTCMDDNGMKCKCAANYFHDTDTDKCWKRSYEGECTVGATGNENQDCMPNKELVCREDDDETTKCLCAAAVPNGAAAYKWNPKSMMCVADDAPVGLAKDAECEVNQCGNNLMCMRCPLEADTVSMKCRPLMTDGSGSGESSEETSGAAHLATGVATIILSAVAMFL